MYRSAAKSKTEHFIDCRYGGVAIIFALSLPVLLAAVGSAIDYGMAIKAKQIAQSEVDASVLRLAAKKAQSGSGSQGTSLDSENEQSILTRTLNAISATQLRGNIEINYTATSVKIYAPLNYSTFIMRLFHINTMNVSVVSEASFPAITVKPFSVGFVLDVSDTMNEPAGGGMSRLWWLKQSVEMFFSAIEEAAGPEALAAGTIKITHASFNDRLMNHGRLTTDYKTTQDEINQYYASGGTNSAPAMDYVYAQLNDAGLLGIDKLSYVIFITDGLNNQGSSTTYTVATCNILKRLGTKIITVGFMATVPPVIRDCASGSALQHNTLDGSTLSRIFTDAAQAIADEIKQSPNVRLTR